MKSYRILQIGDIHYPDWASVGAGIDLGDNALSPELIKAISDHPIKTILRSISESVAARYYDVAILIGDITSKGDAQYFEPALKHLSYLLDIRSKSILAGFVPGNHDVNRQIAISHGIEGKFLPLSEIATQFDWPAPPIGDIATYPLPGSPPPAVIILLNTCLGCGERRFLPQSIRSAVSDAIDAALNERDERGEPTQTANLALEEYYEMIDTPAVHEGALKSLATHLQQLTPTSLPILAGHHNLLPQGMPRVAVYAELLNAGRLRRSLLSLNRSIVYLHGHIHDDPIEIITSPANPSGRLICISAPEISKGYNEVTIFVDRIGRPRGCRIDQFRYSPSTGLIKLTPIDVGLMPGSAPLSSRMAHEIVAEVNNEKKVLWATLKQQLLKTGGNEADADDAVEDVYFSGLIRVSNPGNSLNEWILAV